MLIKINVEVWLAAASLHDAGLAFFSPSTLVSEIGKLFGDTRPGVQIHATAHCVANAPLNIATPYNYLWRQDEARYRLWRLGDGVHPTGTGGRTRPDEVEIPAKYLSLYRKWTSGNLATPSAPARSVAGSNRPLQVASAQPAEPGGLDIARAVGAYYDCAAAAEHHRYRSWEHCYGYFREARRAALAPRRDEASLQLAFYLASWGMYRGSSFLLQYAYTVHRGIIDLVAEPRFDELWEEDLGANESDARLIPVVEELLADIRRVYAPFVPDDAPGQPTDTLITKVVLGTFGCLPACDRFFVDGFKAKGFSYSYLNRAFVERVLGFCQASLPALLEEQVKIRTGRGLFYPLMKLVDMYFWQVGYESKRRDPGSR